MKNLSKVQSDQDVVTVGWIKANINQLVGGGLDNVTVFHNGVDLNNFTNSGYFQVREISDNSPTGKAEIFWGFLRVTKMYMNTQKSNPIILQEFHARSWATGRYYTRFLQDGVWSPWTYFQGVTQN